MKDTLDFYSGLIGVRCAIYVPSGTVFYTLEGFDDKELFFKDEKGNEFVFPRGLHPIKRARDRPRKGKDYGHDTQRIGTND